MNISRLITLLQEAQAQHGDLEVGIPDGEFGTYTTMSQVSVRTATRTGSWVADDDHELGSTFVGLY